MMTKADWKSWGTSLVTVFKIFFIAWFVGFAFMLGALRALQVWLRWPI